MAEIDNLDCILGNDFIEDFNISIKFVKGIMQIGKHKVKLEKQSKSRVCRIKISKTFTIPPSTEVVTTNSLGGQILRKDSYFVKV